MQRALAEVILELHCGSDDADKLSVAETVTRLNTLDWGPDNPTWQGILLNGNKVIAGASAQKLATRMICYLLGQKLEPIEIAKLKEAFLGNNPDRDFPAKIF